MTVATSEIPTRGAHTAARRRVILLAALQVFREKGFAAATIEDIRGRSGASTGSIYHHFGSKDGVASALYEEGLADYRAGLTAALDVVDGAELLVRAIVLFHMDWAATNPDWARYLLTMRREQPVAAIEGNIRRSSAAFLGDLFARFRPYIDRGDIASMPAELYAAQLIGPAQEFLRLWLSGRSRVDPATAAPQLADAAWRALRRPNT